MKFAFEKLIKRPPFKNRVAQKLKAFHVAFFFTRDHRDRGGCVFIWGFVASKLRIGVKDSQFDTLDIATQKCHHECIIVSDIKIEYKKNWNAKSGIEAIL